MSCSSPSEGQAALTGSVGKGRDATVVLVAGAVEDDLAHARGLGALGDELTDLAGLGGLVTLEGPEVLLGGRRERQRLADQVVDDLDGDVLGGTCDHQARTLCGAVHLLAATHLATQARRGTSSGVLVVLQRDRHVTYRPF